MVFVGRNGAPHVTVPMLQNAPERREIDSVRPPPPEAVGPMYAVSVFPTRRRFGDPLFRGISALFAGVLLAILASVVVVLAWESWGAIREFGWGFLTTSAWDPVFKRFGALPFI